MKIGFWSILHGQTGQTSNMIAATIYNASIYQRKTAVMQTHFRDNMLSYAMIGEDIDGRTMAETGLDLLIRDCKSGPLQQNIVESDGISLMQKYLNLYVGTNKHNYEIYERDMNEYFNDILYAVKSTHDDVFVDINPGYNELSLNVLEKMDLVIVNLSQNLTAIDKYFRRPLEKELEHKPAILYLLGMYDKESIYSIKNIQKKYPSMRKKTIIVEYYSAYRDALNKGNAILFFLKTMDAKKGTKEGDFILSLKESMKKIREWEGENELSL